MHYTTAFANTENPISEAGNWTQGLATGLLWTNTRKTPNLAFGTQTGAAGFDDSISCLTGTWGNDQTCTAVVHTINQYTGSATEVQEVELLLRFGITANNAIGYEVTFACRSDGSGGQYVQVNRWNGGFGGFTLLDSVTGPGLHDGDAIKATIRGATIRCYINEVLVLTVTDATYASGKPGIGFYAQNVAASSDYGLTSFSATDQPVFGDLLQSMTQEIASSGHAITKAYPGSVTLGSLLIVATYAAGTVGACTVTDTRGNVWLTSVSAVNASDGHEIFLSWAIAKDTGACTVTTSVSAIADTTFFGMIGAEYKGTFLTPTAIERTASATGNSGSISSGATAPTTFASSFCVGVMGGANSATDLPVGTNDYTTRATVVNATKWQLGLLDNLVGAVGAQTATATIGTAQQWSALVATFPQASTATIAVSGSVSDGTTEAEIIAGGQTLVLTLGGDTYLAGWNFDQQRAALRDGITSAQSEAAGWNATVRPNIPLTNIVRTGNAVVTVTLQAQTLPRYGIVDQETVTPTVPGAIITSGVAVVSDIGFVVTPSHKVGPFPTHLPGVVYP